jgi:uroporphyrinogen decarboxylase
MVKTLLKNDRMIRALHRQPVDKTPIWIMRQAGRYLPEYRAIREKVPDFLSLCKTPALACEITLQPLKRFDLDAAIIFSDILTIPDAMGLDLHFQEGEGPYFNKPIRTLKDIEQLSIPDPDEKLSYVSEAIRYTQQALGGRVPLIGFSGSPWTLACYMVEGKSSKDFSKIKSLRYKAPEALDQLIDKLAHSVMLYLKAQIHAGADIVMLFDTWGGVLTPADYLHYALSPMKRILTELDGIPTILFTKGGGLWLEAMVDSGANALGLDWTIDLSIAKKQVGNKVALQGNLDPALLYASPERIRSAVRQIMVEMRGHAGYVFNLGHGIYPDVPPEHVGVLVDAVHAFS